MFFLFLYIFPFSRRYLKFFLMFLQRFWFIFAIVPLSFSLPSLAVLSSVALFLALACFRFSATFVLFATFCFSSSFGFCFSIVSLEVYSDPSCHFLLLSLSVYIFLSFPDMFC